ncbi:MAG: HAD family phosphatase [Candidatus Levybacteria bacterium]|nr:HAD family phosphatase [Candidatus Levybacteria bacterium]
MIKAIIFDFFDVIRSDPYKAWLHNHGYKREGEFLNVVDAMDSGKINLQEFLNSLSTLSGQSYEEIVAEFESVSRVDLELVEFIKALKNNYKIGLLSNAPSKYIRDILSENRLEKYFDEIVISSEVGHTKPSREIFEIMLDKLSLNPADVVFIDDSKTHIEGAEKIGIRSIQYESLTQLKNDLEKLQVQ